MSTDRRQGTTRGNDYTVVQQSKRIRCTKQEDETMSDRQCISLLPTSSDNFITTPTWKGWKTLSNESSPNTAKENQEFPPLTSNMFDSWFTPEPIKNWADFMDEEETHKNTKLSNTGPKKQRFKRKLLLSENGDKPSEKKSDRSILTDEHRLSQRQKQIDFGKNTTAYGRYILESPRHCRKLGEPRTPDKFQICSTRSWCGQIKSWRRKLHEWDPPTEGQANLFSLHSKSAAMNDIMTKLDLDMDERGSTASSNSSEEFFKDLNVDACLAKDPHFLRF